MPNAILGLTNLKGCDGNENPSYGLVAFTVVFGLCCILVWMILRVGDQVGNQYQQLQNEPDAEPAVDDSADMDVDDVLSMPASTT